MRQLAIWLLSLLVGVSYACQAEPYQARTVEIPPHGFIDPATEQQRGYYFDVMNEALLTAGIAFEHKIYPYPRVLNDLNKGKIDLLFMMDRPGLNENTNSGFLIEHLYIVTLSKSHHPIQQLEDLVSKRVGHIRGAAYLPPTIYDRITNITQVTTYGQLVEMLLLDRLDVIMGVNTSLYYQLSRKNAGQYRFASPLNIGSRRVTLLLGPQLRHTMQEQQILDALTQLKTSGRFEQLKQRYITLPGVKNQRHAEQTQSKTQH